MRDQFGLDPLHTAQAANLAVRAKLMKWGWAD